MYKSISQNVKMSSKNEFIPRLRFEPIPPHSRGDYAKALSLSAIQVCYRQIHGFSEIILADFCNGDELINRSIEAESSTFLKNPVR